MSPLVLEIVTILVITGLAFGIAYGVTRLVMGVVA